MTAALMKGPVGLTDTQGKQLFIPLALIYFDTAGAIKADQWPPYKANEVDHALIDGWLQYLARNGVIVPDTIPPPKAAMAIKAKDPGGEGNNVQLTFSTVKVDPKTPGDSTLDVVVTETNTYTGITTATLASLIGTDAPSAGSKPGLVHLKGSSAPVLPKNGDYPLTGGADGVSATADISKNQGAGKAFIVEAKRAGDDGNKITVSINDVDKNAGTFTLSAVWTKSVKPIKVSDLPASFAYEVDITAPPGGVLAAPAAGVITLSGGADTQAPTPASTIVLASQ